MPVQSGVLESLEHQEHFPVNFHDFGKMGMDITCRRFEPQTLWLSNHLCVGGFRPANSIVGIRYESRPIIYFKILLYFLYCVAQGEAYKLVSVIHSTNTLDPTGMSVYGIITIPFFQYKCEESISLSWAVGENFFAKLHRAATEEELSSFKVGWCLWRVKVVRGLGMPRSDEAMTDSVALLYAWLYHTTWWKWESSVTHTWLEG